MQRPVNGVPIYALAQFGVSNQESVMLRRVRPSNERANSYLAPNAYNRAVNLGIVESFDCKPSGGTIKNPSDNGIVAIPPRFLQPRPPYDHRFFPPVAKGQVRLKTPPRGTTAGNTPGS